MFLTHLPRMTYTVMGHRTDRSPHPTLECSIDLSDIVHDEDTFAALLNALFDRTRFTLILSRAGRNARRYVMILSIRRPTLPLYASAPITPRTARHLRSLLVHTTTWLLTVRAGERTQHYQIQHRTGRTTRVAEYGQ